jgi:hypothetical protein
LRSRHWSIRKLADYLATNPSPQARLGRERLRQLLRRNDISFQRTRTWNESRDPDKDAKLDCNTSLPAHRRSDTSPTLP